MVNSRSGRRGRGKDCMTERERWEGVIKCQRWEDTRCIPQSPSPQSTVQMWSSGPLLPLLHQHFGMALPSHPCSPLTALMELVCWNCHTPHPPGFLLSPGFSKQISLPVRRAKLLDVWIIHRLTSICLLFWRVWDKDMTSLHKDFHLSICLQRKSDIWAHVPS